MQEAQGLLAIQNLAIGIENLKVVFQSSDGFSGIDTTIARQNLGPYVSMAREIAGPNGRMDAEILYKSIPAEVCKKLRQVVLPLKQNESFIYSIIVDNVLDGKCHWIRNSTVILRIIK